MSEKNFVQMDFHPVGVRRNNSVVPAALATAHCPLPTD
jgi:hypothetical protein